MSFGDTNQLGSVQCYHCDRADPAIEGRIPVRWRSAGEKHHDCPDCSSRFGPPGPNHPKTSGEGWKRRPSHPPEEAVYRNDESFLQTFPWVDTLQLTITESGSGVSAWSARGGAHERSVKDRIQCSNPLCKASYPIGPILDDAVKKRFPSVTGKLYCMGAEPSVKGRTSHARCSNHIQYDARLTYIGSGAKKP